MASDWIKWVKGLTRRAEVVRMACGHPSAANVDRRRIAVACMEFWEWADDETSDGQLVGVGAAFIDDLVGLPGFYVGMVTVGWIIETSPNSIMLANFDRHNGSTAKRRAKDVEYKREGRSSASRADTRPHPARTDCGPEKRREEERREEEPDPETASPKIAPTCPSAEERNQIRQGLIRIGIESGAAQQVSLHPLLTVAMVTSNMASVKKSPGVKSHAAVLLTRLRRELEIAE